ncbi:MAG: hypothetical protein KC656_19980 [Myxococcales bacterium]|nr:hypothetical protein [Myxococcales bacterium]MCB9693935.1 hypothetical protein [Alphaproteobacteria bacterium]
MPEPSITIAYPDLNGEPWPLECVRNPDYDCNAVAPVDPPYLEMLEMLVVVDVDDIQLQNPYVDGITKVEGQGHWHATLGALAGYQPAYERSTVIEASLLDLTLGTTRLTVSLQDNEHDDIAGANTTDSLEFELVRAADDCSTLPADYCPDP